MILGAILVSSTGYATLVYADDEARNCCSKSDACRYMDNATQCNAAGPGNGCSGTYGYCCANDCPSEDNN